MDKPATHSETARSAGSPPDWPTTDRPLRIALLGWARLSFQANQGSGYNLSASELAVGLAMSGHSVSYLASGRRYNLWPRSYISPTETWRGIECFDLVNSPNLSPASYNFANMPAETSHRGQNELVLRWLRERKIEVVHIHSLEGYPLDLIQQMRSAGLIVVVTPHNYWYACPQVDLMFNERTLCEDYDGGNKCEPCMKRKNPRSHRVKRRVGQVFERLVGMEISGACRKIGQSLPMRWRELTGKVAPEPVNARLPDPESASGFSLNPAFDDGQIRHGLLPERFDNIRRPVGKTPIDANEQFLRDTRHLVVLNDYGKRRQNGMASLAAASMVIPPSDFVRRVYVRMGLPDSRSRVVRLGQPHFDQLNRRAQRSPYYDKRPWDPATATRPLRFAFFGAMRPSKGIDVMTEAITLLPRHIRQRCQFHLRAQGFDWPLRKKLSAYPEVSFNGGYDLLQLIGAGGEYDVGVLPHVWFENSPLVLLEHLHAGKFVISSRLGGVVEWLDPPRNGMLFAGGHADQLAQCMQRLVLAEVPIPSPREIHEATPILRSYPDHVREVEQLYRELLNPADAPIITDARRTSPLPS